MAAALPEALEHVDTSLSVSHDTPWQVVVSNDPVNLVQMVAKIFERVLGMEPSVAMKHTMEVHNNGRSAVYSGTQQECTIVAEKLMAFQLWTHIEKAGQ